MGWLDGTETLHHRGHTPRPRENRLPGPDTSVSDTETGTPKKPVPFPVV